MFTHTLGLLAGVAAVASAAPVLEERDLSSDPSRFTFYDMPTPFAGPCDLATGSDGNIYGQDILVNKLFKISLDKNGEVTEYDIPYNGTASDPSVLPNLNGVTALACAIRQGEDGNVYAASGLRNQLVRLNPSSGKVDVFTPQPYNPLGDLLFLNDIWCGDKGCYITSTSGNVVNFFDYYSETFKQYPVPTPNSFPVGLYIASDKKLYGAEFLGNKVFRFDPATEKFEEFPIPVPFTGPAVVRAETQGGKYIWFTGFTGNSMVRLDSGSGQIDLYDVPYTRAMPVEDTVDKDGRVWFSSATNSALDYIDSNTLKFGRVTEPGSLLTDPINIPPYVNIAVNYGPGNAIYFTDPPYNKVGRYQI